MQRSWILSKALQCNLKQLGTMQSNLKQNFKVIYQLTHVEDIMKSEANRENAMQSEANVDNTDFETKNIVIETEIVPQDVDGNLVGRKKFRGPTRMKRLPSNPVHRIDVEFNEMGVPIGESPIKFSSYLGPLVRERVSFTIDDWRNINKDLEYILRSSIKAIFRLDED